jgi:glycosyltransferase involved in cell wall biosynthesis
MKTLTLRSLVLAVAQGGTLLVVLCSMSQAQGGPPNQALQSSVKSLKVSVSLNGRYFVGQQGKPFFYLGDTAWLLFQRLNHEEVDEYLKDRAGKGLTVIQAYVLPGLAANHPDGATSLLGATPLVERDPTRPNEVFFRNVDGALRWGLMRTGLTRVVHIHLEEGEPSLRWAFKSPPDLIISCARFLVDLVRRALPKGSAGRTRIVAVPNAVDTEQFTPGSKEQAKARVGAPAGRPLLLMLANLAPHKGQETAIRAVALLKQRGLEVTCWLAGLERHGEGAYTARLRTLIHEAGVGDRVQLLGQRRDAPDLLRAADFFLLPSTNEGLPLSVLEAQATRVPVLAAPTAGIPEVVRDDETGFLIPASDVEGYARRVEQLLANPGLADRVAEAAFLHTTREHSWTTYCRRVVELYDEVLERG